MAKKFFNDDWEKLSKEELSNSRARLSGFIESTTEKEKTIRDVSVIWGLKHYYNVQMIFLEVGKKSREMRE